MSPSVADANALSTVRLGSCGCVPEFRLLPFSATNTVFPGRKDKSTPSTSRLPVAISPATKLLTQMFCQRFDSVPSAYVSSWSGIMSDAI